MKYVFNGASKFGLACVELQCGIADVRMVGVVTPPQAFSISYQPTGVVNMLNTDIEFPQHKNMPIRTPRTTMIEPALLNVKNWRNCYDIL